MKNNIISSGKIGFRLPVKSPYIITAHHIDYYPKGNGKLAPVEYLKERNIGNDFDLEAPWRMYYGDKIPGFPVHPHRGFETVTIVEQGFVDHTDSLGGAGRYGEGDVQWLTAGSGIQHCEMFPLVYENRKNTMELFQIWLNLPSKNKMVAPHYKMFWNEDIPIVHEVDENGRKVDIKIIAGKYGEISPLSPPPDSWAYDEKNNVSIWLITLAPEAVFTLKAGSPTSGRIIYYYKGENVQVDGVNFDSGSYVELVSDEKIIIKNGREQSKILLLGGEPINEPVSAHGPFVMNTEKELLEAYLDYEKTHFGGWKWKEGGPVNPPDAGRFAKYEDGSIEKK